MSVIRGEINCERSYRLREPARGVHCAGRRFVYRFQVASRNFSIFTRRRSTSPRLQRSLELRFLPPYAGEHVRPASKLITVTAEYASETKRESALASGFIRTGGKY